MKKILDFIFEMFSPLIAFWIGMKTGEEIFLFADKPFLFWVGFWIGALVLIAMIVEIKHQLSADDQYPKRKQQPDEGEA